VEPQLSTHDGDHTEHGADVQSDVDEELKHEPDHVLLVTNVVPDVLDHQLNHEPAEHPSSTLDWELSEHGAHVPHDVDLELKLEAVCVLLVTNVVHHVTEL